MMETEKLAWAEGMRGRMADRSGLKARRLLAGKQIGGKVCRG